MRKPDRRDRKVLRTSSLELHSLASSLRDRKWHIPADDPVGYVDAFAIELRSLARHVEDCSRTMTVAEAKRSATSFNGPTEMQKARSNAVSAFYVMVNRHALWAGVDPYEGMKGEDVNSS